MKRRSLIAALGIVTTLVFCTSAGAEIMVIGAPLDRGGWAGKSCETAGCGFLNEYGRAPSPGVAPIWWDPPISGVIVRLNVAGATTSGMLRVRTIGYIDAFDKNFETASGPIPVVPSAGVQTYPLDMPITNGSQVGLSMSQGTSIGFLAGEGRYTFWKSDPPESGPSRWDGEGSGLVGFNVEVQPPPSISIISTDPIPPLTSVPTATGAATPPPFGPPARVAGPTTGGTQVFISGGNFEGASSVTFGSAPATSFTVVSEHEVDAIAPPSATPSSASISVTTIAGTATSTQKYEYFVPDESSAPSVTCIVPNLKGKTLKAARAALRTAQCKLGKVTKLDGATPKSGKVSKQGAKAGASVVVGTKVDLTIKPAKTADKKGAKGKRGGS